MRRDAFRCLVGARIKTARKRMGISQIELAVQLRRTQSSVNHWETGYAAPQLFEMWPLCRVLGLTPNDLLNDDCHQGERRC